MRIPADHGAPSARSEPGLEPQFEPSGSRQFPGYLRGLAFSGDFAVVGLSQSLGNKTFSGLAPGAALAHRGTQARCALMVIDLRTGDAVHWGVRLGGVVQELYDVVTLSNVARPSAIGFKAEGIRRVVSVGGLPAR